MLDLNKNIKLLSKKNYNNLISPTSKMDKTKINS